MAEPCTHPHHTDPARRDLAALAAHYRAIRDTLGDIRHVTDAATSQIPDGTCTACARGIAATGVAAACAIIDSLGLPDRAPLHIAWLLGEGPAGSARPEGGRPSGTG